MSESLTQGFGFTAVLEKQAHTGYATFFLVQLWSQKTSQASDIIDSSLLSACNLNIITLVMIQRERLIFGKM